MSLVRTWAIARVAYEAERVYAYALGEGAGPRWEEAPGDEQGAAIAGVEAVLSGEARTGAHLHEAWARNGASCPAASVVALRYEELTVEQRRKILLFRAVVLALVDGPCNGFCHDEKCANLEDHDCHLETCMSRFGVPPGLWRSDPPRNPRTGSGPPANHPTPADRRGDPGVGSLGQSTSSPDANRTAAPAGGEEAAATAYC